MSRPTIVIVLLSLALGGCWANTAEPSFTIPAGLNPTASAAIDSLVSDFPPPMLDPGVCDTVSLAPRAHALLDSLTLPQKIAQLIIARLEPGRGDSPASSALELVERYQIGGFQIPRLMHPDDVAFQTALLQYRSRIPLFVAADYERGVGRFNNAFTELPSNMGIGATGQPWLAALAGRLTGIEARAIGVNLLFAPVVDVNTNPINPIINIRSYGDLPPEVTANAAAFIREVQRYGIVATAKHFPGHGSAGIDSHNGLPEIHGTVDALEATHLQPFNSLLGTRSEPAAIMSGHLWVSTFDPLPVPATLSYDVVGAYLRRAKGYDGLVITDDLRMGALSPYPLRDRLVRALIAGNDMLLTPADVPGAIQAVETSVLAGDLEMAIIDSAAYRVIRTKLQHCIGATGVRRHVPRVNEVAPGSRVATYIAERAVTLVNRDGGAFPPRGHVDMIHVVSVPGSATIDNAISMLDSADLPTQPDESGGTAIAVVYARLLEGRGTAGLRPGQYEQIMEHLRSRPSALVVILGNPYLARLFEGIPVLVGYDQSEATVAAVAEALQGELVPVGRLPVSLQHNE